MCLPCAVGAVVGGGGGRRIGARSRSAPYAPLYRYTENAIYLDAKGKPTPWAPTRRRIGDLPEALAAICILPQDLAQPCWLDGRVSGQIVAAANGLYDLDSKQLLPHSPLYFGTVSVPFAYEPIAPEPTRFIEFLGELWPQETAAVDALQEWFGISFPAASTCRRCC